MILGDLITHSRRSSDAITQETIAGGERFTELASTAGAALLSTSREAWDTLKPDDHDLDPDLGIVNDLWIHGDRFLYRRDQALKLREQIKVAKGDFDSVVVPVGDRYYLRRLLNTSDATVWLVALFNLAWRIDSLPPSCRVPLRARREAWRGCDPGSYVSFDTAEDLRNIAEAPKRGFMQVTPAADTLVDLPLRWCRATLSGDPFLASAYAIDLLAMSVERHQRDTNVTVDDWQPPAGFIGANAVRGHHGVSGSTLQYWVETYPPLKIETNPKNRERYFPVEWVNERLKRWNKRPN